MIHLRKEATMNNKAVLAEGVEMHTMRFPVHAGNVYMFSDGQPICDSRIRKSNPKHEDSRLCLEMDKGTSVAIFGSAICFPRISGKWGCWKTRSGFVIMRYDFHGFSGKEHIQTERRSYHVLTWIKQ